MATYIAYPINNSIWTGQASTASSDISYLPISRDNQKNVLLQFQLDTTIRSYLNNASTVQLRMTPSSGSGDTQKLYLNARASISGITYPATAYTETKSGFYVIGSADITYENGYSTWTLQLNNLKAFLNNNTSGSYLYLFIFGVTQNLESTYYDMDAANSAYRPQLIITYTEPTPSLTISPSSLTLQTGSSAQVTVTPASSITWTSLDTSIATVNSSGVVTGVSPGATTIVAAASGYNNAYCSVTVTAQPALSITPSSTTLSVNDTQTLAINPTSLTNTDVTWSSSNTSVVTVTTAGLITGISTGTATITAQKSGYQSATCSVTVTEELYIQLTPTNLTLSSGESYQFTVNTNSSAGYTFSMTAATGCSITTSGLFSSDGSNSSQVSCTITVRLNEDSSKTASTTVTVRAASANLSITLTPSRLFFIHNTTTPEQQLLHAYVEPSTASISGTQWLFTSEEVGTEQSWSAGSNERALEIISTGDYACLLQDRNTALAHGSLTCYDSATNKYADWYSEYFVGQLDVLDANSNVISSAQTYTLNLQQSLIITARLRAAYFLNSRWSSGIFGADYNHNICAVTIGTPSDFTTEAEIGVKKTCTYTIAAKTAGTTTIYPYFLDENGVYHYTTPITIVVNSPIYYKVTENGTSTWKQCLVYYRQNGQWIQCDPYYRQNNTWQTLR